MGGADADDRGREWSPSDKPNRTGSYLKHRGLSVGTAMTKPETKKSGARSSSAAPAVKQDDNGALEVGCPDSSPSGKAKVMRQTSKESLHRRHAECEVYDDGTNTFFWSVIGGCVVTVKVI